MQLTPLTTTGGGPICGESTICSESLLCGVASMTLSRLAAAVETLNVLAAGVETLIVLQTIEHGYEFFYPGGYPGPPSYPGEYGAEVGYTLTPLDTGTLTLTPLSED